MKQLIPEDSKKHKTFFINFRFFVEEMLDLIKSPVFILLSLIGNLMIGFFSLVFYSIEHDVNPNIKTWMDALWWGMSTATTTGYGDITPITVPGKLLGMLLMLMGLALFAMFTALFAETILNSTKINTQTNRKRDSL
jgi:voltage-gated potassium channel